MLRSQLDQASDGEQAAVREVRRELDRAELDNERLRERLQELELKEQTLGRSEPCLSKELMNVATQERA